MTKTVLEQERVSRQPAGRSDVRFWASGCAILSLFALAACVGSEAPPSAFARVFFQCGEPCVLSENDGGELALFLAAADEAKTNPHRLIIDGPCRSSCAVYADRARDTICITENAEFGFHKALVYSADLSEMLAVIEPPHSQDIRAWVVAQSGFPESGMLVMIADTARHFWRPCRPDELRAAGLPST